MSIYSFSWSNFSSLSQISLLFPTSHETRYTFNLFCFTSYLSCFLRRRSSKFRSQSLSDLSPTRLMFKQLIMFVGWKLRIAHTLAPTIFSDIHTDLVVHTSLLSLSFSASNSTCLSSLKTEQTDGVEVGHINENELLSISCRLQFWGYWPPKMHWDITGGTLNAGDQTTGYDNDSVTSVLLTVINSTRFQQTNLQFQVPVSLHHKQQAHRHNGSKYSSIFYNLVNTENQHKQRFVSGCMLAISSII